MKNLPVINLDNHLLCANTGGITIDFMPGQLAAFSRLGSLRHLDLNHIGIGKIFRRHPKATGSNLFDGRAFTVSIIKLLVTVRFFTAFTGV